jgi:hypothetical protein
VAVEHGRGTKRRKRSGVALLDVASRFDTSVCALLWLCVIRASKLSSRVVMNCCPYVTPYVLASCPSSDFKARLHLVPADPETVYQPGCSPQHVLPVPIVKLSKQN